MGQNRQALGDRPEAIRAQSLHGQAAERDHDPDAVALAVEMRVLQELGVQVASAMSSRSTSGRERAEAASLPQCVNA